jgi:chromosome partitioning protein
VQIISIINQKGGVGKSTTAQNIGVGLKLRGYKVLLIDLDPQGNLSYSLKAPIGKIGSYGLFTGWQVKNLIEICKEVQIIPKDYRITNVIEAKNMGTDKLKNALTPIKKDYDYIIIDTPPALSIITVNALVASTRVIIPTLADIFSMQGIKELNKTILSVKRHSNKNLQVMGIVLTRHNNRIILNREVARKLADIAKELNAKLYRQYIRECVSLREAQTHQQSIFAYAPSSNARQDYDNLVTEIING